MVGSRMSGSSASPMRSVVWAGAPAVRERSSAAAVTAKRKILIALSPYLHRRWRRPDYINPATACTFRAAAEGRHQFFQHWRKTAIRRDDCLGRRQFRGAVAGGGMACSIGKQSRLFGVAALDGVGATGVKPAARRWGERARHFALQHN